MEDQEKAEVVKIETEVENEVAQSQSNITEAMLAGVEVRGNIIRSIGPVIIPKTCHPANLTARNGKVYVDDSGCQKISRAIGISFDKPTIREGYEDDENGNKEWVVRVEGGASVFNQDIFEIGACTEKDKFISDNSNLRGAQKKIMVSKKAIKNWRGRCVRGMLGLDGITVEELAANGMDTSQITVIEYQKGKTSGKSDDSAEAKKKLGEMMLKDCKEDKAAAGELLEVLTTFEGDKGTVKGKSSIAKLTDKQAGYSWGNYKKGGKERENYEVQLAEILRTYGLDKAEK